MRRTCRTWMVSTDHGRCSRSTSTTWSSPRSPSGRASGCSAVLGPDAVGVPVESGAFQGLSTLLSRGRSPIISGVPFVHETATARGPGPKEIDRAVCLELLGTGEIGRVVYTEGAMPAAHPVNYLLDGEEVVFRIGEGVKLA